MIHSSTEQIFIYNGNPQNALFFSRFEDLHSFGTFTTENIFQLQQYTQAISPRVLIFNITDAQTLADLKTILHHTPPKYPLIVVAPRSIHLQPNENVAHYIPADDPQMLTDVVESYCLGNRRHDVMLLASYSAESYPLKTALLQDNHSVFEVHHPEAARLYLARNKPRIVCIEYSPAFIPARHTLLHPHIFYVDRAQDITEIKKFLH